MRSQSAVRTIRIEEVRPLGSITLAPKSMTGCSESDLARSMAEAVSDTAQDSPADVLAELRDIFPDIPLSLRVAALHILLRRKA
jgi:hypothetical protein